MKRGQFIVVEGGDGTGKSTCLDYLRERLAGQSVVFTHEPGGTEIGQEIREILLRHRETHFEPLAELLLFAAARAQHLAEKIRPLLASGTHVICDRFTPSSFAYQIRANERGELEPLFTAVHEFVVGETQPDLYLLLDLDPQVAAARMKSRGAGNRLDEKGLAYHARVRAGMLEYVKNYHHQIIDAAAALETVREAVWQAVKSQLSVRMFPRSSKESDDVK